MPPCCCGTGVGGTTSSETIPTTVRMETLSYCSTKRRFGLVCACLFVSSYVPCKLHSCSIFQVSDADLDDTIWSTADECEFNWGTDSFRFIVLLSLLSLNWGQWRSGFFPTSRDFWWFCSLLTLPERSRRMEKQREQRSAWFDSASRQSRASNRCRFGVGRPFNLPRRKKKTPAAN